MFDAEHPFPIDIENLMNETLEIVRPRLVQCKSYNEACEACEKLEAEYKAKIGKEQVMFQRYVNLFDIEFLTGFSIYMHKGECQRG